MLKMPEYEYNLSRIKTTSPISKKLTYYIISVDVGRKGCDTVACVFRVTPRPQGGESLKTLVNIFTFSEEHFEDQAIKIKRLFYKFKAKRVIIDANGLGLGLVDYMVKSQVDPESNEEYPDFGVFMRDDRDQTYKHFRTPTTELDAMYLMRANAALNTEIHANAQTQLNAGRIRFLIDERTAKQALLSNRLGTEMTSEQRADYLKPYTLTSILKEEMMNLREQTEGINIILKRANTAIQKDKFSASKRNGDKHYGLYYFL